MVASPNPPLVCPECDRRLRLSPLEARCGGGHRFPRAGGVVDLVPTLVDSPAAAFDSFYGAVYDAGVQHPRIASPVARLLWGADLAEMYRLMDRGSRAAAGQVVLDVPVGGAPVLERATSLRCTYMGVDLSAAMLRRAAEVAQQRGFVNATLVRADATALPLPDHSVDRVLCFNGLHVMPDKAAVLAEFARVLKPGGELWGSVLVRPEQFHRRLLRPWTSRAAWFFHPADASAVRETAAAAGFRRWRQENNGALLVIRGRL